MGNFFFVIASRESPQEQTGVFLKGLRNARLLKGLHLTSRVEVPGMSIAFFARKNGSGTPIVTDERSNSWLFSIGTWFHEKGYGPGDESRLLGHYLRAGMPQLVRELEGFFVIVVGDGRTNELFLITDIIGSCHGFIRHCDRSIAVSSSSLILASLKDFTLDPIACQEFLHTGVIYEDRTPYAEVRKLEPSSIYCFANGVMKSKTRYWRVSDLTPDSLQGKQAVDALAESLVNAASKIGRVFQQPVCDLTGGYDSRATVAAFLTAKVKISTTVSGPPDSPDVMISQGLASKLGLSHLIQPARDQSSVDELESAFSYTDGEYDLIDYARILNVHSSLCEKYDISINGSFGEVARGYWWELLFPWTGALRTLDAGRLARLRFATQSADVSLLKPEMRFDLAAHFAGVIERCNAEVQSLPNTIQMDNSYLFMRMQRWQGRIASSTNQLWPCLSPFMFRTVMEVMLKIKSGLRRRGLIIRMMLAQLQPVLAAYPLEHGYPAMPCSWTNLHRYAPLLDYYLRKVVSRTASSLRISSIQSGDKTGAARTRLSLWRDARIRELLQPDRICKFAIFDRNALGRFLDQSQKGEFAFHSQWARLLTLAHAMRRLEQGENRMGRL